MKPDLIEYICALSDNQLDVVDEILVKKYKKFINFFELVRDYGDDIADLTYNLSDDNTLDVIITMRGKVKKDINDGMKTDLEAMGYQVISSIKKNILQITLVYDE